MKNLILSLLLVLSTISNVKAQSQVQQHLFRTYAYSIHEKVDNNYLEWTPYVEEKGSIAFFTNTSSVKCNGLSELTNKFTDLKFIKKAGETEYYSATDGNSDVTIRIEKQEDYVIYFTFPHGTIAYTCKKVY